MESGEMFHTLKFTVDDAYSFLKDIEKIEETGILCRIPNWWRKKNSMLSVNVKLGEEKPSMVGFDALVSLQPSLEVDGVRLTQSEIEQLLRQTEGLAFLKGKWIEVNHEKLRKLLEEMEDIPESLSFRDAVQLEMGNDKILPDVGIVVSNGAWMSRMLLNLREPNRIRSVAVPKTLKATLRPYQKSGYSWLNYMNRLGVGACLADDMGLGKTIQVLTYLEKLRKTDKDAKEELPFLTITTYAMAAKIEPLKEKEWDCLILDEAQAIKNPTTKQTREIKK
ncbi:MAG: SNF2 helicase-associated domain-containing protein [Dorea formicigenerans]